MPCLVVAGLLCTSTHAKSLQAEDRPHFELWNKKEYGRPVWYYLTYDEKKQADVSDFSKLEPGAWVERPSAEGIVAWISGFNPLYVGKAKRFTFRSGKDVYIRFGEGGKFGPQTGPRKGLGHKTIRGYPKEDNVTTKDIFAVPSLIANKSLKRLEKTFGDVATTNFAKLAEQYPNLEELRLDFGRLSEFPLGITKLKHLKKLTVVSNTFTSLPPEIGLLRELEMLELHSNGLTALPEEIWQLGHLWYLGLRNNNFSAQEKERISKIWPPGRVKIAF